MELERELKLGSAKIRNFSTLVSRLIPACFGDGFGDILGELLDVGAVLYCCIYFISLVFIMMDGMNCTMITSVWATMMMVRVMDDYAYDHF